jgi:myosin heavy subunit
MTRTFFPAAVLLAWAAAVPLTAANERSTADAYVLAMGKSCMSTNLDFDAFARMREKRAGDFLWFRRAGKTYLIEDVATLRQANELFAPLRALEPEQQDLSRRQEELGQKEEELDRQQDEFESQMERLTEEAGDTEGDWDEEFTVSEQTGPPSEEELAAIQKELDELRGQKDALRPRQRELETKDRELEAVERRLDAREEKLEAEAETKLWDMMDAAVRSGAAKPSPRE